MKNRFLNSSFIVSLLLSLSPSLSTSRAQEPTVSVKDLPLNGPKTTSITIGKSKPLRSTHPEFTILKGSQELEGEPNANPKDAYQNWKTACTEWKTETQELNKKNEVITLDCGRSKLERAESGQKVYRSSATYQIKVRMRSESALPGAKAAATKDYEGPDAEDAEDEEEDDDLSDG